MQHVTNGRRNKDRKPEKPTPKEIRAVCRKIQAEWSENERRRRSGHLDRRWTVPEVSVVTSGVSAVLHDG